MLARWHDSTQQDAHTVEDFALYGVELVEREDRLVPFRCAQPRLRKPCTPSPTRD